MSISRIALRLTDRLLRAAAALLAAVVGLYSAYALWDNARVYTAADDVRADMLRLKPDHETDGGASFAELRAVNGDVRAWLTLDGTAIDYPVLQGTDNMTYLNRDVYGRFALAGSIFLDAGCDGGFGGAYALLYGHHMENSLMFGDLDSYRDAVFFRGNTTGTLLLPEGGAPPDGAGLPGGARLRRCRFSGEALAEGCSRTAGLCRRKRFAPERCGVGGRPPQRRAGAGSGHLCRRLYRCPDGGACICGIRHHPIIDRRMSL